MIYPLPHSLKLRQCPEYISIPEYQNKKIKAGPEIFASLSPEARTTVVVVVAGLAIGLAAYFIAQRNKRK